MCSSIIPDCFCLHIIIVKGSCYVDSVTLRGGKGSAAPGAWSNFLRETSGDLNDKQGERKGETALCTTGFFPDIFLF